MRFYLLFIILLSAIPTHGQLKGVDPQYFETGLWVCHNGGDAASYRIEADNIKPISWATLTSTGCSLLVRWGDGKATAWVGIRSWLSYMGWHVVRRPEKKMDDRIQ